MVIDNPHIFDVCKLTDRWKLQPSGQRLHSLNVPFFCIEDKGIDLDIPDHVLPMYSQPVTIKTTDWEDGDWLGLRYPWLKPFLSRIYEVLLEKFGKECLTDGVADITIMRNESASTKWLNANPFIHPEKNELTFLWSSHPSMEVYQGALNEESVELLANGKESPEDIMVLEGARLYVVDKFVPYRIISDKGITIALSVS